MGAEVGRFERFVFLFYLYFVGVLFLFFGAVIFWSFRFLLEKLKVTFPFSTDTVTLYLNVS